MAKSKLMSALDRQKGRNYGLEKQRKLEKAAQKRKQKSQAEQGDRDGDSDEDDPVVLDTGVTGGDEVDWGTDEEDDEDDREAAAMFDASRLADSDSDSDDDDEEDEPPRKNGAHLNGTKHQAEDGEDDEEEEEEEVEEDDDDDDIPLSDLDSIASEEKGDITPYQRLTINNTTALTAALKRIALPTSTMPFSAHQTLSTAEPVSIPDIDDDLNRELAFYKQSLTAVQEARALLKKEGMPFTRPIDYFAEMVKSDEHMGRVRQKLVDAAASKKAASEARKQRDLKKFGKAVQVEKQRERAKEKRETLERISTLKRKRAGADLTATNEEDLFDVALDDAATTERQEKEAKRQQRREAGGARGGGNPSSKRQKRDDKFGFGGKKRHKKSNDAASSADTRGFSARKMKADGFGGGGGRGGVARGGKSGGSNRPGKSRRASMR